MKKTLSKLATAMVLIALLVGIMIIPADAVAETDYCHSGYATAGEWHNDPVHNLKSETLAAPSGGDVGIWFYTGATPLQDSFYPSSSRNVVSRLFEKDDFGTDTLARTYQSKYDKVEGEYVHTSAWVTYTYSGKIEDDPIVELYMSFYFGKHSKDTSVSLPQGIFHYKFWAY